MKELLEAIEKLSNEYQFSFQFWGSGENNVYIMKNDVELCGIGGYLTVQDVMIAALQYVYRINDTPYDERVC